MEYAIARLAVHTNEQVLHPAAMLDYRARLRELVAAGASYEAALLWGSALEIQHVLPIPADVLDALPPGVPPIRVVPCVDLGCIRCREGRGRYQFPFIAPVLVAPGTSPSDAREQYHGDATTLSGIQVLGLSSRLWPTDILPDHANRLVQHVRHQQHAWLYGCCSVPLRRAWRSCPHFVPRVVARRPCAAAGVTAPFVWTPWQDAHAVPSLRPSSSSWPGRWSQGLCFVTGAVPRASLPVQGSLQPLLVAGLLRLSRMCYAWLPPLRRPASLGPWAVAHHGWHLRRAGYGRRWSLVG